MDLKNDHNVYILGAGFSREAGLPLVSDFLVRMRDSHPWLMSKGRQKEADAVQKVLEFRLEAASAAYWINLDLENIEELFSLASASAGPVSSHIPHAIAATLDFATETAEKPPLNLRLENLDWVPSASWLTGARKEAPGKYIANNQVTRYPHHTAKLLGMFQDGKPKGDNTFITFNYDTVLEESLSALQVAFSYGFKKQSFNRDASARTTDEGNPLKVLKLHGSLNWARQTSKRGRALTLFGTYSDVLKAGYVPELVPPTWKKLFHGQLGDVWKSAVQSLQTATRVIIIGFSMPPTDMHFKYLIASGLQRNISLRQIKFFSLGIEEIEARAKLLLRESYIQSGSITFEGCQFGTLAENKHFLASIGRPIPANGQIQFY